MQQDRALSQFEAWFGPEIGHCKPIGLNGLRHALSRLGDPQHVLAPIIHVAGTNGKGSTIAFARAVAEAAGLRVHAFTKPHLLNLRERYTIAGETVEDDALLAAGMRVVDAAPELTHFDAQVAAAFLLFAETPADVVLLETGMGGREDSTNLVKHPAASVITPIGLDHQDVLGATLGQVAAHKAGVIKRGRPVVCARQPDEAMRVIEAAAEAARAPLLRQGAEWDAYLDRGRLVVQVESRALDLPPPSMIGVHQAVNAGLAVVALLNTGLVQAEDAFARGLDAARVPGRFQPLADGRIAAPMLASGGEVWLDVGHNAHAARALAQALQALDRRSPKPNIAIIGMRARKDAEAFIKMLAPAVSQIIAVPLPEDHISPEALVGLARAGRLAASAAPSLDEALRVAAMTPHARVLICGSFLLVGEALRA